MPSYEPKFYLALLVATSCFLLASAAASDQCNFVQRETDSPVFGYKLYDSTSPLNTAASVSQKLCVKGLWAMYNKENYGKDQELSTLVWPLEGTSETDCTAGNVNYVLKQIKSVQLLAQDAPEQPGFSIFSYNYFLKEIEEAKTDSYYDATGTTNLIRSLAFYTASGLDRLTAVLCPAPPAQTTNCYCYDYTSGTRFLVPEPQNFLPGKEKELDCVAFHPSTSDVGLCKGQTIARSAGCKMPANRTMIATTYEVEEYD